MHRSAAAACLLAALLAAAVSGCAEVAPAPTAAAAPAGLLVVTTGGTALVDGEIDVPPTLDLRVSTGSPLGAGVAASLDGVTLALARADAAVVASVPPMALGSAHRLTLTVAGRAPAEYGFRVVAPSGAHAAVHRDPRDGVVLDLAVELAPADRGAVAAALPPGGAQTWVDARHLRVAWAAPPGGGVDLPASLATERGGHLAGDLHVSLDDPGAALVTADVPAAAVGAGSPPLVIAFSVATAASRAAVRAHAAQISLLSPAGLVAGADGSVAGAPDGDAVVTATAAGVPLAPLVQQLDAGAAAQLVGDPTAVAHLVLALRARAAEGRWRGVQLDVENLPASARTGLTALAGALGAGLHADGRLLVVDAVPHRPGHLTAASAAFDLAALARAADLVVLMAYEEHGASSGAGPVGGLDWQEQLLAGSLGEVGDPARAALGLPLYGMSWRRDGGDAFADGYGPLVAAALASPGARFDYDFAAATPSIVTPAATTYLDDAASLARRLAVAASDRLAGVALWRLGFEDPLVWSRLPIRAARL